MIIVRPPLAYASIGLLDLLTTVMKTADCRGRVDARPSIMERSPKW